MISAKFVERWKLFARLLPLAVMLVMMAGCLGGLPTTAPVKPVIDSDVALRVPETLALDVVNFTWAYLNGGGHMRFTGTVRNNTGAPVQAVTFSAVAYDEAGRPVGQGDSFLAPTYLPEGAEGSFEITVMPARTSGVQHIRLETRAWVRQ
ncbi:MAG: FxLYD domain-containing protein [Candidatus Adiutrix sp.]|jgi:hypothetical protein|nr:FxLYD domain-containing protein [Candidatus Adiutrix sp.]